MPLLLTFGSDAFHPQSIRGTEFSPRINADSFTALFVLGFIHPHFLKALTVEVARSAGSNRIGISPPFYLKTKEETKRFFNLRFVKALKTHDG